MSRKLLLGLALILAFVLQPNSGLKVAQAQVQQQEITLAGSALRVVSHAAAAAEADERAVIETPTLRVPLAKAEPFLAVAPMVRLTEANDALALFYRAAGKDFDWTAWTEAVIDRDATPRGSGSLSTLLFLPQETAQVQFQLRGQSASPLATTQISEFKISFISPGKSAPASQFRPLPQAHASLLSPESSVAKYPRPVIASRTDWGCPDGQSNPRATPSYTTVTHLIVHHTAGSNSASDWAAVVRAIWNFHIFTNGWSDVGYNYLIDPNGVIYEGRAGGDNVVGAHFSCQNSGTMGVALLGTFTSAQPSAAALNSLRELLSWKADQRNIDPAASSYHNGMQQALPNIAGHRDGNGLARSCTATECPGNTFYPLLSNLRAEAKSLVNPVNDFTLTTTTDKQYATPGKVVMFPINSAIAAGTAQPISLSLRNLPSGFRASFTTETLATGTSTQLSLTIPDGAAAGTYPITVLGTGTTKRAMDLFVTVTGTLASVSAASYLNSASVAADSIVAAFGVNLANETKAAEARPLPQTLAEVSVRIRDSLGNELAAPLFFVSPTQINYQVPGALARGPASVMVLNRTDVVALGQLEIVSTAPGLFSANANGQGAAVGALQRRQANGADIFEPLAQFDDGQKLFVPRSLDLRTTTEQFFLTLYGTGLRGRSTTLPVKAEIDGTDVEVLYAGDQQEFIGLDQVNLRLPSSLAGRGSVEVRLQLDNQWTNPLQLRFQ